MRRICFVGASTVEGMGDETGLGWPGRLWQAHRGEDSAFVAYNLGIRGQTLNQFRKRAHQECEQRFQRTMGPIIILGTGANDLSRFAEGDYQGKPRTPQASLLRNFRELITDLSALATLLVIGPPLIDEDRMPYKMEKQPSLDFRLEDIAAVSLLYRDICKDNDIAFFNLYEALSQSPVYRRSLSEGMDGLHPTGMGYQVIADQVGEWSAWKAALDKGWA